MAVVFGGGVGRQGKMCGCLSGALMVIGLQYGEGSTEDVAVRNKNYDLAKAFCKVFSDANGAMGCKDIIKYNLNNLEERNEAQKNNVFKTRCAKVVTETTKLLEDFLQELR